MVTALERSGDDSVKSWPFPKSSSVVAARVPPDGIDASATPSARPVLNKSLDSAAPSRVVSLSSVRRMAASFEEGKSKLAARAPSTPGKVAGLVSSFDAKANTPPTGPKASAARPVLESSPWKSHGIGSSGGSSSSSGGASPLGKRQVAAVSLAAHRAHLAPVQQRLFEATAVTPEKAGGQSAGPQSGGDDRGPNAVVKASLARIPARLVPATVTPEAAARAGPAPEVDPPSSAAVTVGTSLDRATTDSPLSEAYDFETATPGATRSDSLATPPKASPPCPALDGRLQRRSQSAKLMEKIGRFEPQGRGTAAGDPITSGASASVASSVHIVVIDGAGAADIDGTVSGDAAPTRRARDPPATSPPKEGGEAVTPAANKVRPTKQDSTLFMEYSMTPSKIHGGDSWLTPSMSEAIETDHGKPDPAAEKLLLSPHTMEQSGSGASSLGLKQEQNADGNVYPRRVPMVTLFPRSSGGDAFDLPTTPNRTGDSIDLSSLQASPIIQANESFVTLEESWRANTVTFKDDALQDVSESARGWSSLFPPAISSGPNAEPASDGGRSLGRFFGGWSKNLAPNDRATGTGATLMDEFSVKETPRMNNHSFTSETSASPKGRNQKRGVPPTIPNKLSQAPKGFFSSSHTKVPDLTTSSYDTCRQSEEYSQDRSRPSTEYQTSQDMSSGISSRCTNSSETCSEVSGAAEHTGSFSDPQLIDSKCTYESSSVRMDALCSDAANGRSTNVYEDCEDIFEGLEVEHDDKHENQSSTAKAQSSCMNNKQIAMAKTMCTAPSQASSTTSVVSNRVYDKRLRSSLKTMKTKTKELDQSTQHCCQHESKPSQAMQPTVQAKMHRGAYRSFRIAAANQGFPVKADTLFQHRYADEYSTSDDSSCSYSTYTATTFDTPLAPNSGAGLAKAFFDFLTFGDDESAMTLESESLVTSITGGFKSTSSKDPVKKVKESKLPLGPEFKSGPSFAATVLQDLLKFMDCNTNNDDLLRTTEQHLLDEFGISSDVVENEMPVGHGPEIENLVFDATFFQNLWTEISSRGSGNAAWNVNLCGSASGFDCVADDMSLEDQKIFDTVFPSDMASQTVRRKAAQVLTLCRKRFPSLYQVLVGQLEKKARHKKMAPYQRVTSPLSTLPPVEEEGAETEDDDISADASSKILLLSFQNEATTTLMSAPSSTYGSELSDDRVPIDSGVDDTGLMSTACILPLKNNCQTNTSTADKEGLETQQKHHDSTWTSRDFTRTYLDVSREERLILDYPSTEKECKESDGDDGHQNCDRPLTEGETVAAVKETSEIIALDWQTFTPPRRQNARTPVIVRATQNDGFTSQKTRRSLSAPCQGTSPSDTWEHFTDEKQDPRLSSKIRDILPPQERLSSNATLVPDLANNRKAGSTMEATNQWEAFTISYFEASNEEHLVATVKRNNKKKLKPSKYDSGYSLNRSRRLQQASLSTPEPPKPFDDTAAQTSPTAVAPPQIRKLKVADLLYPPSQLDFEKF